MRLLLVLSMVLALVGCVKKDSIRFANLPAKPVEQVELLSAPPSKPFKIIGHVMIKGAMAASWQRVANGAREEAADMGADAVFIGNAEEYQAGTYISPAGSTTTTNGTFTNQSFNATGNTSIGPTTAIAIQKKRLTGIAIVYLDSP